MLGTAQLDIQVMSVVVMYFSYIPGDIVGYTPFKHMVELEGEAVVRTFRVPHVERAGIRLVMTDDEIIISLINKLNSPTIRHSPPLYGRDLPFHSIGLNTRLVPFRYCIKGYAKLDHILEEKMPTIEKCHSGSIFHDCLTRNQTNNSTIQAIIRELNLRKPRDDLDKIAYIYQIVNEIQNIADIVDREEFCLLANKVFKHPNGMSLSDYIINERISLDKPVDLSVYLPDNISNHDIKEMIICPPFSVRARNPRTDADIFCIIVKNLSENARVSFLEETSRVIASTPDTIGCHNWKIAAMRANNTRDLIYAYLNNFTDSVIFGGNIIAQVASPEIIHELNKIVDASPFSA